jgi:coenzyme PQQ precursor peptide PqqA
LPDTAGPGGGDRKMEWTKPEFVEVKMDAEINSYQDDFSGI